MGEFVAILILVACPVGTSTCIKEPVRVVSYDSSLECKANKEEEIRKAARPGFEIIGDCNAFNRNLLTGHIHLNVTRNIETMKMETSKPDQGEILSGFIR